MKSYTFIPKVFSLLLFGFLIVSGYVLMGPIWTVQTVVDEDGPDQDVRRGPRRMTKRAIPVSKVSSPNCFTVRQ